RPAPASDRPPPPPARAPAPTVHEAERQAIGVGVLLHLQHAGDQDVAQVLMQRDDCVDGGDVERQAVRDVARVERAVQQRLEPATRDDQRAPPANCARNRTSLSNSTRVSGAKNLRANVARVALKSTNVIPSSTASPSICWNTGACEASNGSRRYTCPGITTRMGGG